MSTIKIVSSFNNYISKKAALKLPLKIIVVED